MKKLCLIALLAGFLAISSSICSSDLSSSTDITQETEQFTITQSFSMGKSWIYEYLKNTVKQAIMKISDLREPSPELRLLAEEVLRENGITQDIIILEGDNLGAAAYVRQIPPFTFLVVNSKRTNDLWVIYHEVGHIYHNHSIRFVQKELGAILVALLVNYFENKLPFLSPHWSRSLSILLITPILIKILFIKHFSRQDEKEADLFASTQLIKQNKVDPVLRTLVTGKLIEEGWHPTTAEYREYTQKCLLDHGVSQETITSYISKYVDEQSELLIEGLHSVKKLMKYYDLPTLPNEASKLLEQENLSLEEVHAIIRYLSQALNVLEARKALASSN